MAKALSTSPATDYSRKPDWQVCLRAALAFLCFLHAGSLTPSIAAPPFQLDDSNHRSLKHSLSKTGKVLLLCRNSSSSSKKAVFISVFGTGAAATTLAASCFLIYRHRKSPFGDYCQPFASPSKDESPLLSRRAKGAAEWRKGVRCFFVRHIVCTEVAAL